jgi:hypothetical protein
VKILVVDGERAIRFSLAELLESDRPRCASARRCRLA